MPRKDFLRDLEQAVAPGRFRSITNVRAGECDGSISFTFTESKKGLSLDLQAIVSGKRTFLVMSSLIVLLTIVIDSHDYPREHSYLLFSESESCPRTVTASLEHTGSSLTGSTLDELLNSITNVITNAIIDHDSTSSTDGKGDTPEFNDWESTSDNNELDWESEDEENLFGPIQNESELRKKIRRDLRMAKTAGFKVGFLGSTGGTIIVSVSCRIAKLGISEEAMDAWNVKPSEYLVLLIRYIPTYIDLPMAIDLAGKANKARIQMHVGLCDSYKPSFEYALEVFQDTSSQDTKEKNTAFDKRNTVSDKTVTGHPLRMLFIGKSLDTLLGERLLGIVKLRLQYGLSWTGAELLFQINQGKMPSHSDSSLQEYSQPDSWPISASKFLAADHVAEMDHNAWDISMPLLAMQFTLRHFVKCTDFCLVCHCKTGDSFEAIKPYVCSNGLCLYQYMALGMGPSLEYEICSQPLAVELLISLAYARATSWLLEDFPTGLGLRVPAKLLQAEAGEDSFHAGQLNAADLDLLTTVPPPVRVGDWIVMRGGVLLDQKEETDDWHCRVERIGETSGHIQISPLTRHGKQSEPSSFSFSREYLKVKFVVYDTSLDDLTAPEKQKMVSVILGTLPEVQAMISFIKSGSKSNLLSTWKQRISPAGLDLLRWIVASNRSFITQNDNDTAQQVSGMDDYIQFRLVQGAADKEQRFIEAVNSVSLAENPSHPTLFAWHGSPVYNWHSILREGFHFKQIAHGRACGDGVYMSNHFSTSLSYSSKNYVPFPSWPQNRLKISHMVSLNEVVNAPKGFVCQTPHYVVQHLDWIQPRYLFVRLQDPHLARSSISQELARPDGHLFYRQDKEHFAFGPNGAAIKIPMSILRGQRAESIQANAESGNKDLASRPSPPKKRKCMVERDDDFGGDDTASIETDMDDIAILLSDDESTEKDIAATVKDEATTHTDPKTDYRPDLLEEGSLPLLSPPQYATTPATKILQQHLTASIKTQKQVPLHHLGWYVNHNLITTVYQWIVELHSFDPTLLLAKDLKKLKMQSIVLELRFPPQFPMDPPFVRVIRPRFLEFAHGGGGHVTSGGAMCLELLTQSGWLPTASIESVLLQVRMAILNPDPRPARLLLNSSKTDYSVGEAVEAYKRVSVAHGWQISKDIQNIAW
jgi:ubiquitin-conjugating enzyme E2 Q